MGSEQQAPMTLWCGGINADQDVSIRLVPNGINQQQVTNLGSREPLAVFKVHSNRLKKHSEYFQACLSQRWTHPDANLSPPPMKFNLELQKWTHPGANPSPPSMEFNLELIHGLQVASYTDCFSRMYSTLRKNFKDVKSSLQLLRVASQIEFHELVDTICRYLSTVFWSEEDELRIRQFSSCPDFPRSQAEDLVKRLQIEETAYEVCLRRLLCSGQIKHIIHIALRQDGSGHGNRFRSAQSLFEDLFSSIGQSEIDSAFENDVVRIVCNEVKEMLEDFHKDCSQHASCQDRLGETKVVIDAGRVSGFKGKLKALCWALELLLKAQVAEEVIECLLDFGLYYPIIEAAKVMDSGKPASKNVALRFCKLVILIFQEVVAGRLLLGIRDRVSLIEDWHRIDDLDTQNDVLVTRGFGQALEGVFLTLPLKEQLLTLKQDSFFFHAFINRSLLVAQMKRNWPTEESDAVQADLEVESVDSDSMET